MKHTGKAHTSPGAPSFGKGGTRISAMMLKTMTAPMTRNQRDDNPRPDLGEGSVASATSRGSSCSLDTLLHTQERGIRRARSF